MANRYLEKIANDHMIVSLISPAWQRHRIAQDHGLKDAGNWGQTLATDAGGDARAGLRSAAEGYAGGVVGSAVGALVNPVAGLRTGKIAGRILGGVHGYWKSHRNQARDFHHEFRNGNLRNDEQIS